MSEAQQDSGDAGTGTVVVGLLSDPDYPSQLAGRLVDGLPGRLAELIDDSVRWEVRIDDDPISAVTRDIGEILRSVGRRAESNRWDLVVYLTDLPIRESWVPVVAELSMRHRAAVLSLPALGATLKRSFTGETLVRLIGVLDKHYTDPGIDPGQYRTAVGRRVAALSHPVLRTEPRQPEVDLRFTASRVRGRLQLLAGMVYTNRPWRLVFGMSSALAAAVAMSAFMLQSEVVWRISDTIGLPRLILAGFASVVVMVVWIVVAHGLWERFTGGADREYAVLYNMTTVCTLTSGVLVMYAAVFAFNWLTAQFLITPEVLGATLGQPVGAGEYLQLAWLTAAAATVAGALGSGLEDEDTVRQAAYGYRERQRQRQRRTEE